MKQMHYATTAATLSLGAVVALMGSGVAVPAMAENGFGAAQDRSDRQRELRGPSIREEATSEATANSLPGNRRVTGHIKDIRGNQMEIAIGNLQPLSVPLKMAADRGQTFKRGDAIVVTLNDHNAVVDYHHPDEASHHQVIRGKLSTPLTVGLDKAVIATDQATDDKDEAITKRVNEQMDKDAGLKKAGIHARTNAGVVSLSGEVADLMASAQASWIAWQVSGVKSVKNDLTVKEKA